MSFISFQNKRGGKVKLNNISFPTIMEFDDAEKGDALRCKLEILVSSLYFIFYFSHVKVFIGAHVCYCMCVSNGAHLGIGEACL